MKVLQINAVSRISSTGRTSSEMADFLNQNGHEGFIAYSAGLPYYNGYKIGSKLDTKLHGLFSRVFGLQAYFSKRATRKLLDYITDLKPDVVHLRNLHSNYINLKLLTNFLAKNDIPTVMTLHDCWFYTGKCTYYTTDNCFKWQTGCGGCPRLKKDNPSWFFDRTYKMHHDKKKWFSAIPRLAVVGVSDWITNEARKSFLSSAKIITRIYNWVDLETFKPSEPTTLKKKLSLQDKFIILGVASGWSNAKGLDKFIELAGKVSSDITIVLVGGMKGNINLPANVIHINETHDTTELAQYYSLADVYLHLSLEETFGKTIAEAMACGTPAVVFDSTACSEVVGNDCGIVVSPNDMEAVYKAVLEIKSSGKGKYAEKCIKRTFKCFNPKINMDQTLKLYQQLIHNDN
jgi:glycosyltransferase involved in cell wall biosynthesis